MKNKTTKTSSLRAGLLVLLSVSGAISAGAQSVTPTTEQPPSATLPSAAGVPAITAGSTSTAATAVPNITATGAAANGAATSTTAAAVPVIPAADAAKSAAASGTAPVVPPVAPNGASATAVTPPVVPSAAPAAAQASAAASVAAVKPAAASAAPSAAEMAIVQNSGILNTMSPQPPAGSSMKNGMKVTDILAQPATVRPLPEKYLVVKKDREGTDSDARLTSARMALWQGHYQTALEIFDDLSKKRPNDTRIIMGRAVALQKLGQTDDALTAYQGVLAKDPKNVEALTNMLGLLKGQDAVTAVDKLRHLRDMYPANAEVTAQLGMVYGVSGDYANALKYLDMADTLKPGNPVVLYNKAVAYDRMGHELEAADLYRKLLLVVGDNDQASSFPLDAVRNRLASMR